MAFPHSNSFNASSGSASGAGAGTLDTLIRGELKVTDPRDAAQIAAALMARYKDDPRTSAITQEARGLPFLLASPTPAPPSISATSSDVELHQATSDVERSLQDLRGSALLDDVLPELGAWAQAIRAAIDDGGAARDLVSILASGTKFSRSGSNWVTTPEWRGWSANSRLPRMPIIGSWRLVSMRLRP